MAASVEVGLVSQDDDSAHYTVQVVNMPPTEIVCKCGARFVGGDVIAKQKAHMEQAQIDTSWAQSLSNEHIAEVIESLASEYKGHRRAALYVEAAQRLREGTPRQ